MVLPPGRWDRGRRTSNASGRRRALEANMGPARGRRKGPSRQRQYMGSGVNPSPAMLGATAGGSGSSFAGLQHVAEELWREQVEPERGDSACQVWWMPRMTSAQSNAADPRGKRLASSKKLDATCSTANASTCHSATRSSKPSY